VCHKLKGGEYVLSHTLYVCCASSQCFSIAGSWLGTEPRHHLYRVARGSPGSYFSFLSIFRE
jgi:hypothetical protein